MSSFTHFDATIVPYSTCIHTATFDSIHSICLNQRISIDLIQWLRVLVCMFSILSSDTRLISSFIYFMADMEQNEPRRYECDNEKWNRPSIYFSCFTMHPLCYSVSYNFFFISAMTSVNETSIHSNICRTIGSVTSVEMIKCPSFMTLWFQFVMGFWSAAAHYYHFKSLRLQAQYIDL